VTAVPSPGPRAEDERLVAFLGARTGEDEAAAEELAPFWAPSSEAVLLDRPLTGIEVRHIARHDPARELREVAAKRRRLEDYRQAARACRAARPGMGPPLLAYRDACYRAVLADAAIWDGHPDYEHRWKLS